MDKEHLDFSDILFTELMAASVNEEEISSEDIEITKRYLFLIKRRIETGGRISCGNGMQ
ncbi:hypothetical protein NHG23_08395 [Aerococcaceae bacterium NML190073]|nr:hypothetical protein [Aerococcaceae bacterium NML190073]